jgi:hypothetical protein
MGSDHVATHETKCESLTLRDEMRQSVELRLRLSESRRTEGEVRFWKKSEGMVR